MILTLNSGFKVSRLYSFKEFKPFTLIIDLVIFSVFTCSWFDLNFPARDSDVAATQQKDAEAVWRDRRQAGPGAASVWAPDWERGGGAALCARRGRGTLPYLRPNVLWIYYECRATLKFSSLEAYICLFVIKTVINVL